MPTVEERSDLHPYPAHRPTRSASMLAPRHSGTEVADAAVFWSVVRPLFGGLVSLQQVSATRTAGSS